VHDALRAVLEAFYAAKKPIGCTCISPMILAKVFEGKQSLRMTVGQAPGAIEQLEAMGMEAVPAAVTEMIADEANRIYTTPCYMEPDDLPGMFEGIKKLVEKLG
jgi:enhancing lycopene biosynthesis protein 2